MNQNSIAIKSSNKAAYASLVALVPVFVAIVTIGWKRILSNVIIIPEFNENVGYIHGLVGFLIAVIGIVLARSVATELRDKRNNISQSNDFTWVAYFFVLVVISALGTMNTLFMATESQNVLKESIQETISETNKLRSFIYRNVSTPDFDNRKKDHEFKSMQLENAVKNLEIDLKQIVSNKEEFLSAEKSKVKSRFESFIQEGQNPQRPGFGEESRKRLKEVQELLPEFKPLSGNVNNLSQDMIGEYRKKFQIEVERSYNVENSICEISDQIQKSYFIIKEIIPTIGNLDKGYCSSFNKILIEIKTKINNFKESKPTPISDEVKKNEFKVSADSQLAKEVSKLEDHYKDLNHINKEFTSPILKSAWSKYSEILQKTRDNYPDMEEFDAIIKKNGILKSIANENIDSLGIITNTINYLILRYDRVTTYIIIFAGLIFDVILISFFLRHISAIQHNNDNDEEYLNEYKRNKIKNLMNS